MAVAARKKKQVDLWAQTLKDRGEKFATIVSGTEYGLLRGSLAALNDHRCHICRGKRAIGSRAAFDHHHGTGVARAVLCKQCNLALGYPENALGDRAATASAEEWERASTGFRHPKTRQHVEGIGGWAALAQAYHVKWAPVVEAMGGVYRKHIGEGKRIGSPARDRISPAAFADIGEVLVQQSRRIRALYTPEQIEAKRERRKLGWGRDWMRSMHGEGVGRPVQGQGEAWTWARHTRVVCVMLLALDWMADVKWQALGPDGLPVDPGAEAEGAFPVLAVDVGWIEDKGTVWRAVSHKGLTRAALAEQIGRAV